MFAKLLQRYRAKHFYDENVPLLNVLPTNMDERYTRYRVVSPTSFFIGKSGELVVFCYDRHGRTKTAIHAPGTWREAYIFYSDMEGYDG